MIGKFTAENETDVLGAPRGGYVKGVGIDIRWQQGALGRGADKKEPNGAFVETVIAALIQRIEHYQTVSGGKFRCGENIVAIDMLKEALMWLNKRTADREAREVEGTHQA